MTCPRKVQHAVKKKKRKHKREKKSRAKYKKLTSTSAGYENPLWDFTIHHGGFNLGEAGRFVQPICLHELFRLGLESNRDLDEGPATEM